MTTTKMPWFRMYTEAVDDEKLRLLAFEDRWHFVALLCLKGAGVLDDTDPLLKRKVSVKMGVTVDTLDEIVRRLREVGLVQEGSLQPVKWDDRQMRSDSSTDRVRAHREKSKKTETVSETGLKQDGNGDETLQQRSSNGLDKDTEEDKESEKEKDKNPTQTRERAAGESDQGDKGKGKSEEPAQVSIAAMQAEGVDKQHARDWLTIRKAKRLPLTPTAWNDVKAQAALADMSPAVAVELAVKSGWAGFKASWVATAAASGAANKPAVDHEWYLSIDGIKTFGDSLGVAPQKADEKFAQYKARVFKTAGHGPWIDKMLAEYRNTESVYTELLAFFGYQPAETAAA